MNDPDQSEGERAAGGLCFVHEIDRGSIGWLYGFHLPRPYILLSAEELAEYLHFRNYDPKYLSQDRAVQQASWLKWTCVTRRHPVPPILWETPDHELDIYLSELRRRKIDLRRHTLETDALSGFMFPASHLKRCRNLRHHITHKPQLAEDESLICLNNYYLFYDDDAINCLELEMGRLFCPVCDRVHAVTDLRVVSWMPIEPSRIERKIGRRNIHRTVFCPAEHLVIGDPPC